MSTNPWEQVNIDDLMSVGAHFGHKRQSWNPKMSSYIYGINKRNNMHIINLAKSMFMWKRALKKIVDVSSKSGRILFVGTKPQAAQLVKEAAVYCGQHYVNVRWPSGILTNWSTIASAIRKFVANEKLLQEATKEGTYTKKELLMLERKNKKTEKLFGGVKNMGGLPNLIFVIDTKKESIAIKEAQKFGIPVVAIVDTNSDPEGITYPVPGNDDSIRAIKYYCSLVSSAVLGGIELDLKGNAKTDGKSSDNRNRDNKDNRNRDGKGRRDFKARDRDPRGEGKGRSDDKTEKVTRRTYTKNSSAVENNKENKDSK